MAIKISGTTVIDDSRNVNAGIVTANQFVGSGDNLIFSPTITSFSPTDGATGVTALNEAPNFVLTYNQPVSIGTTGTITLRTVSAAGTIAESFSVGVSTRATVSNQTLTIDPTGKLDYNTNYYVVVPQGTVTNYVGGNSGLLNTYDFTTEAGPTLSSVSPGIGSTNITLTDNIVLTFNKNIRVGVGTITLRTVSAAGTITESYDVSSSNRLTFASNTLTIDPTSNLSIGTTYYTVVPSGAVAGYAGISTYYFQSIGFALSSIAPPNGATNVGIGTTITLTFTSAPTRGTGTVVLRSGSVGGTTIESFDAASSARISVVGNTWNLTPTSILASLTSIFTIIPSTAIPNYAGLNTTGADSHSFTTRALILGESFEGGYLICREASINWIVAPASSEVSRTWYLRDDANTTAQSVSGCTGWFVPTCGQLQNPGYTCRTYWDSYSATNYYWSSTEAHTTIRAWNLCINSGIQCPHAKTNTRCVRAFRCVTY